MNVKHHYNFAYALVTAVLVQLCVALILEGLFHLFRLDREGFGRWAHLLSSALISASVGALIFEFMNISYSI